MKSTDSRECCQCHVVAAMNTEPQGKTAQMQHRRIGSEGKTCIDCHFRIVRKEPAGGNEPAGAVAPGGST